MERRVSREYAFPLKAFALSFWWAWVSLTFLGSSHTPLMWNDWLIGYPAISFSSVLSGALVFAAAIPVLRRHSGLQSSNKVTLVACALTSLSTLLINAPLVFGASSGLIVLVASFVSGIGISLLYVQLGAYYASFSRRQLQSSTLVSFLAGIGIAALALDHGIGTLIVDMLLPWGAAVLLFSARRKADRKGAAHGKASALDAARVSASDDARSKRPRFTWARILPARTVALIVVLSLAFGVFRSVLSHPHDQNIAVPLSFATCAVLCVLILVAVLVFSVSLNLELVLYVALLITALTAFGLSLTEEANWALVWAAVLATVRCCDLVMWILFGEVARTSGEPAGSVFAFGKLVGQVGVASGLAAGALIEGLSPDPKNSLLPISLLLIVALLVIGASVVMKGLGSQSSVAGEGSFRLEKSSETMDSLLATMAEKYGLTKREIEVLEYLLYGRTIPSIAEKLTVAPSTVRTHVKGLYRKLDVHSRQELLDFIETLEK